MTLTAKSQLMQKLHRCARATTLLIEAFTLPLLASAAVLLWLYRRIGSDRLSLSTWVLRLIGVFPIRDHYYEPCFIHGSSRNDAAQNPYLEIDFNLQQQLLLLEKLGYQDEFTSFLQDENQKTAGKKFTIDNGSFGRGDSEFLFNYLRFLQPRRLIEIGCGYSTLVADAALKANLNETGIAAKHICIEPYEQPWLETLPRIELIRQKLEDVDLSMFSDLTNGDLLFIDSSHIIRPGGDVVIEYTHILPKLASGVVVHIHDIFTPRPYPDFWMQNKVLFWNEQQLLECLLANSTRYSLRASLNHLKHCEFEALKKCCPQLREDTEPGSIYLQVN